MIIPLDKAVKFYELKNQIHKALSIMYWMAKGPHAEATALRLIEKIEAIDKKYPMKGSAILINKENENESN